MNAPDKKPLRLTELAHGGGRGCKLAPAIMIPKIKSAEDVQLVESLLSSGPARNAAEAILWHGGEAEAAREAYRQMSRAKREALAAFLHSL